MTSMSGLDTGLFICGENKFVIFEWTSIPHLLVQIEDGTGFLSELGVARKNPGSVLPGADGIFVEPPPHGAATDGGDQAGLTGISGNVLRAPAR